MIDGLVVGAGGRHGLEVTVRPVPHNQPRQLIDAPRPGVVHPIAEAVSDVSRELLEGVVSHRLGGCWLYQFHAANVATAPTIANTNPAGW